MDFWDTIIPTRQSLPPDFTPNSPGVDTGQTFSDFGQRVGSGLLNYLRWNLIGSPGGTPGEIGMGMINSAANAGRMMTTPALLPPAGSVTDDTGMISQGRADPAAWQAFVRDQNERQNLAPRTALGMIGGGASFAERGALGAAGGRALTPAEQMAEHGLFQETPTGIRAYHGSPHDFERFDMSRIGTGEGAQAYGHGLYFAENPAVSQTYKTAGMEPKAGHMYEVNINANPEHFLDYGKPLNEQPQADVIRDALFPKNIFGNPQYPKGNAFKNSNGTWTAIDQRTGGYISGFDSKEAANNFMQEHYFKHGALEDPEVTQRLAKAGIPGIKYLDQGSRSAGTGTSNYVVFDDKLIDIIRKYGIAGLGAYLGASQLSIPAQRQPVF
jgi:hypothetical protein